MTKAKKLEKQILDIVMDFPYCYEVKTIHDVWSWISSCDDYELAQEVEDMMYKLKKIGGI